MESGGDAVQKLDGRCDACFWNRDLPRCPYAKMINNVANNCQDWRLRKLTVAEKVKEATVMKAAHASDVARKVEEKKKTKRGKK
jgi:hypothetical protein